MWMTDVCLPSLASLTRGDVSIYGEVERKGYDHISIVSVDII